MNKKHEFIYALCITFIILVYSFSYMQYLKFSLRKHYIT